MDDEAITSIKKQALSRVLTKDVIEQMNKHMLDMFKSDMFVEILIQTKIGKILKYFIDFCKHYSWDSSKLRDYLFKAEQTQKKWKNYINNCLFDDSCDHQDSFKDNLNMKSDKFKKR